MAYLKITGITSYKQLDEWLGARESREVGYKTVARRLNLPGGVDEWFAGIAISQWNTDIYVLNNDNIATLNVGSYFTVTTKQRLNDLLPPGLGIYSDKGRWFVCGNVGGWPRKVSDGYSFYNGMKINVATSQIVAEWAELVESERNAHEQDLENAATKKKIAAYIKGLSDEKIKEIGMYPTSGDCFYCQLEPEVGESLGDGHIRHHIEDRYYFTTLIHNAVSKRGNPYICRTIPSIVRHDLGRYLRKRLLKGVAVA